MGAGHCIRKPSALCLSLLSLLTLAAAAQQPTSRLIRNDPAWPAIFELDRGAAHPILRKVDGREIRRNVKLLSFKELYEPDHWLHLNKSRQTVQQIEVAVEVDGEKATLLARPYQSPQLVNGLRLYVETTRDWVKNRELAHIDDVQKEVRLSAVADGESWGPPMVYPIRDYRFRASAYNNTWSSLVPYNRLYYHAGEDRGAIPDRLDVLAMLPGKITASPLPAGDGKSNSVALLHESGLAIRYAHMNTESIRPEILPGRQVNAGDTLGKTGMTWAGRKSQYNDPHLHVEFLYNNQTLIGTFPFFIDAYWRSYPHDHVLAIAGGYRFTIPNQPVQLDATRSLPRPRDAIASFHWKLSDGTTANAPVISRTYDKPGLYAEELIVRTAAGHEDRDHLQVRVYDPAESGPIPYGWAYHHPVRNIHPNTPVLFWNRLTNTAAPVTIDFGDDSPPQTIQSETTHPYAQPGIYTVTLQSRGPNRQLIEVKMSVVVEKP